MATDRPVTPTIVVLVLLFAGIFFIWSGNTSPSTLKFLDMEIETSSIGLILVVLAAVILVILVLRKDSMIFRRA